MTSKFEELLQKDGRLVYRIRGVSMLPLLRQYKDVVIIEPPCGRLKKYDTALYRRGKSYVLHRVIGVTENGYLIRGDNTYTVENIPEEDILGVLTAFVRGGKNHSVTEKGYIIYSRLWCAIYPVRAVFAGAKRKAVSILRKTGLMPVVKKLLRK